MLLDTLITNVQLGNTGERKSIGIQAGRLVWPTLSATAKWTLDAEGALLLPGLVDPHVHLDKTLSLGLLAGGAEIHSLPDAIARMRQIKSDRSLAQIEAAARRALRMAVQSGVCALRTHVDLGQPEELEVIRVLIALRDQFAGQLQLQIFALAGLDDTESQALVERALALGIDGIGAAPALTAQPHAVIDRGLGIARQTGCWVDFHTDETANPESDCLEYLADQLLREPLSSTVVASHCCSLAFQAPSRQSRVMQKVAAAGIAVVTLPACNLNLVGGDAQPPARGATPAKSLLENGVNVSAGSDNVQDPFHFWGNYDPLQTASICAQVAQITDANVALAMVTQNAAQAMGLNHYGLNAGDVANFCLLDAQSVAQAIAERPTRRWVFFQGAPILKQTLEQHWLTDSPPLHAQ